MSEPAIEQTLRVQGMDCASCVAHVEKAIRKLPGVTDVSVNLALGRAQVKFDPAAVNVDQIAGAVTDAGYPAAASDASAAGEQAHEDAHANHARLWLLRGVIGVGLWLPVEILHWSLQIAGRHAHGVTWMDWLALFTSTIAILLIGGAFYRSAFKALVRGTSNMDTLIALGASVAFGYSLIALIGYQRDWWGTLPQLYFTEGTALLALISVGHWLEARARARAGSAIRDLMHLTPATAIRIGGIRKEESGEKREERENGGKIPVPSSLSSINSHLSSGEKEESGEKREERKIEDGSSSLSSDHHEVPVQSLQLGDLVLVRPGDRVPIDGVVVSGRSSVDESMLTGESVPVTRQAGENVIGGTLNNDGALTVRVTRIGAETALAQIVKLVETAQNSKPPVQRLADRIAAVFVPTVLVLALLTGVGWFIHGVAVGLAPSEMWANIAKAVCSVLIIACPCALGLAVPAALMVGTGRGASMGILFRDIDALQTAEHIGVVVLDKTGTLTRGKPRMQRIVSLNGVTEEELLQFAGSVEQYSTHPLAKAIVNAAKEQGIKLVDPDVFQNEPGLGVRATISGRQLFVGSASYLRSTGFQLANDEESQAHATKVWIARDQQVLGAIELTDELKPDSAEVIRELHKMGLKTVLLTGDHESAARIIAKEVGIDDVRAGVRPDGKAQAIRELQQSTIGGNRHSAISMVGDGINDAPALAQADLGIAIGSGSDIAKETGGIVLVSGSLSGVPSAIRLSRATMRNIRMNLFFAFFYNVIAIPIAALGLLSPIICAGAMALSDITVIGNALRLRRMKL